MATVKMVCSACRGVGKVGPITPSRIGPSRCNMCGGRGYNRVLVAWSKAEHEANDADLREAGIDPK